MRALAILGLLALAGCLAAPAPEGAPVAGDATRPGVVIETSEGPITLVLYPDLMPATTENFLAFAREGFYDGRIFQRVVDNFVIQSEDRAGDPAETLALEPPSVQFAAGVLGMARSVEADSATHVFFVTEYPQPHLDRPEPGATLVLGTYAGFGQVLSGWDAIRAIAAAPKRAPPDQERPVEDQLIVSVREANVTVPADFDDVYPLVVASRENSGELRVTLEHQAILRAGEPTRHVRVFVESRVDRAQEVDADATLVAYQGENEESGFEIELVADPADGNVRTAANLTFPESGEWRLRWARTVAGIPAAVGVEWRVQVEDARATQGAGSSRQ